MIDVTAFIDPKQRAEIERLVAPRVIPRILSSAINDAGRFGETRVNRAVRDVITLSHADTKRVIKRKKATPQNLESVINISREPQSMKRYKPRQTARGVSVKPRKKKPRELLRSAFIAHTVGGHVFRRRGKNRLPIDRIQGPTAVGVLAGEPGVLSTVEGDIIEKLYERTDSKVKAHLEGNFLAT